MSDLTPILFGASAFQYLNAACELGLFELLHEKGSLSKNEIGQHLHLKERALNILLLGTTALRLTKQEENLYCNSSIISDLMIKETWEIFRDIVAFEQYIVYQGQVDFAESLKVNSNVGLRHIPGKGRDLYYRLSENPELEKVFYKYMTSWSKLSNPLLFKYIDFSNIESLVDVGGGSGVNAIELARHSPTTKITLMEIPGTAKIATENVAKANLSGQITVLAGNMFEEGFPEGHQAILFSHQLGIWTEEENVHLLTEAYNALSKNGRVLLFSSMSNDDGDGPLMAALDSVYFASIPSEGGMIYTWNEYESWLKKAGFHEIKRYADVHSWTPHGIIEAIK
jgi:ubiquinone/menaquinone biosynthesis C-methylase UbiE